MRRKLLLLVHRIPYPPNKGDKIRSYHLLRHLAARHEVYLGSFVDDPQDWQHESTLAAMCRQVKLVGLDPKWRKLRSLSGLFTGEALSVPYYRVPALQRWVSEVVADEGITHAVAFSSTMAQYLSGPAFSGIARIADLCDVDSDKWRQYAKGKAGPSRWIYAREAERLLGYERSVAQEFDATL
ncbi:MAG: sugar transferase, partial [Gammaproteobacteria bacterium]